MSAAKRAGSGSAGRGRSATSARSGEECARFALAIGEEHGIWGGTTSQERIAELRRPRGGRSRADIAAARAREAA